MKMLDLCADDRPREKMLERGTAALSNAELLAILLRTGTGRKNVVEVAQTILRRAEGSLEALAGMSVELLCETEGVGPGKAVSLVAAFELGRRWFAEEGAVKRIKLCNPEAVFRMMYPLMRNLDIEECWAIYLTNSNRIIERCRISQGGVQATVVDQRLIVKRALELLSTRIIIVHNHPSGSATPSGADHDITKRIKEATALFDIQLLDHIIISANESYSFKSNGKL